MTNGSWHSSNVSIRLDLQYIVLPRVMGVQVHVAVQISPMPSDIRVVGHDPWMILMDHSLALQVFHYDGPPRGVCYGPMEATKALLSMPD